MPAAFELGLVLAGAVSAGAYSAGVVDFLLEALAAHERRRGQGPDAPTHRVRLKVLAGASAGGIVAGLAAATLAGRPPAAGGSVLRRAWVEAIDIAHLLRTEDLAAPDAPVASLLDSTELARIAKAALDLEPRPALPPYVADPLALYLSVANLRGVPYRIGGGGPTDEGHAMALHADHLQFAVTEAAAPPAAGEPILLPRRRIGETGSPWEALGRAALASAAFPFGLRARPLSRPAAVYGGRLWPVPNATPPPCTRLAAIPPDWPRPAGRYDFLAVDGGLMDNEPLELARRTLAGPGGRNPRGPYEASRAVVLVDPFPEIAPPAAADLRDDLPRVAAALFAALKAQARFKPDELMLAMEEDVYSRFLIAPRRREPDGSLTEPAICAAILGGFGGFLARDFRDHDYRLGRRNCQRFLQRRFVLAAANPLFEGWRGERFRRPRAHGGGMIESLPILPVWPEDLPEEPLPLRPTAAAVARAPLRAALDRRIGAVAGRLMKQEIGGVAGWFARLGWRLVGQPRALNWAMGRIEEELARLGP